MVDSRLLEAHLAHVRGLSLVGGAQEGEEGEGEGIGVEWGLD